jgi:Domain of unknown function (DUF4396)
MRETGSTVAMRESGHATAPPPSLNRLSLSATLHCMTGCVLGEVTGLVIATALGWGDLASIALAIGLAFLFGYALTSLPLFRAGLTLGAVVLAFPFAFAANRYLLARGRGHALVHQYHGHGHG